MDGIAAVIDAETIERAFAYSVAPGGSPSGGQIRPSAPLTAALGRARRPVEAGAGLPVAFVFQPENRPGAARINEVRDLLLEIAFEADPSAAAAALGLASRLALETDNRSKPSLLVVAVFGSTPSRTVVLWTFPEDE